MTSQVLYRKWRPPRFTDVVGQPMVTKTLCQAVATGRLAHAYLFCGPRGTGKTSTARVVAKAVNCLGREAGACDPDGTCAICIAIDKGAFVDLIEIDAASNRGIDEMRDLREKVRFAPSQGRYKVYIIDEAHALTPDAFNAFLKTLEEPPPNTIFILATTEPHRLPATIISRCQRFDFRRISTADVAERLAEIAASEGINAESEALHTIARAAGGSLRDGTNLLDQLITSFGVQVTLEQVRELLGIAGEERAIALVKHLLSGNTAQALEIINATASEGLDLRPLHRMTVDLLRASLLLKSGVRDAIDISKEAQAELGGLAPRVLLEQIMRALRVFGAVSLRHDQPSPLPLELATVELSLGPESSRAAILAPVRGASTGQSATAGASPSPEARPSRPPPERTSAAPLEARPPAPAEGREYGGQANGAAAPSVLDPSAPPDERLAATWPAILRAMSRLPRKKYDIAALLRSSREHHLDGNALVVRFPHQSNSERLQEELTDPASRLAAEGVLGEALGGNYTFRIETTEAGTNPSAGAQPGPLVRAAMSLGGQVVSDAADETAAPEETPHAMEAAPAKGESRSIEASPADPGADS